MNNLSNERASDKDIQQIIDSKEKGTAMFMPVDVYYLIAKELKALREAGKEPVASMHRLVNKRNGDEHPWVCSIGTIPPSEGDIFRVEVIPLYAAPQLPAVPDEREAFESFMVQRFGESIDQRRAKNGNNEYMAWDKAVAWVVWQQRAAIAAAPKPE